MVVCGVVVLPRCFIRAGHFISRCEIFEIIKGPLHPYTGSHSLALSMIQAAPFACSMGGSKVNE